MEFLMTYGWAILVVLAAIGALAYFGVLSPDKFLPDKCTISPPITCLEYKAEVNGANTDITLVLQQDSGTTLNITGVGVEGCGTNYTTEITVDNNAKTSALVLTCPLKAAGSKFKGQVDVSYHPTDGSVVRTVSGTIQTKVEA